MKVSAPQLLLLLLAALPMASAGASSASSGAGTVSAAKTSSSTSSSGSGSGSGPAANDFMSSLARKWTSSDAFHMAPVHVVQARVQADEPVWNAEAARFVSEYYSGLDEAFVDLMDTVNTASVEGALMYVQAECVNYKERSAEDRCERKNSVAYVVFYEMAIVQTNETLALFQDAADQNEYGPMDPMDSGRCTPVSGAGSSEVFPTSCLYFNGDDGEPDVGPFVGGSRKASDARAPYPNNVWYSFPNTCPLKEWSAKTEACRAKTRAGLCPLGVMPDGVHCTYNYRVLGFLLIDDLVGITSMTSNATGRPYSNFSEFCEDGGVEFEADTATGEWEDGLAFWENPRDEAANSERAAKLVEAYASLTSGQMAHSPLAADVVARMRPLPSIASLTAENPPCYMNVKKCNSANGCKRELYGQTCTVCNATSDGCETAPSDWTFPTLAKAAGEDGNEGTASADGSSVIGSAGGVDGKGDADVKSSNGAVASVDAVPVLLSAGAALAASLALY